MPVESETMATENNHVDIDKYRLKVRFYLDANAYESALFWADKVATMSGGDPRDVYWLAQCMFRSRQYHRAAILIRNKGLDKTQPLCQWLAGLCLLEAREYNDALFILSPEEEQLLNTRTASVPVAPSFVIPPIGKHCILEGFTDNTLLSALHLLKGRVYEKLDNRARAAECFKNALKQDVYCYEAFYALVQHQMLSALEEKELLSSLPFKEQCGEHDLLPIVYEVLLNKYQSLPQMPPAPSLPHAHLTENLDLEVARAEKLYYACDYGQCYSLTEDILKKDPYHTTCLPIHISCLVELKKVNKLFYLAHDLVDLMPDKAVSWFAVGCYYFLTGKRDPARRYLGKATSLDRLFGPAWLTYGHSFGVENEHDQAMAAYFTATKLMKGCHLPLLYIGLECGLTNNIRLAERFFNQAQSIAPYDPFVIHEMGIIAFQNHDYNMAEKHFLTALSHVHEINQSMIAEKWEPLLNNLGHTCRKLKKYDDALRYHQQALVLSPQNASTIACIGYVQALQNNLSDAVDTFHKALGLRRDDSFCITMLSYVIEQLMETTPPFPAEHISSSNESDLCQFFPDQLDIEQIKSSQGRHFSTGPLIYLNSSSSEIDSSPEQVHDKQNNLSEYKNFTVAELSSSSDDSSSSDSEMDTSPPDFDPTLKKNYLLAKVMEHMKLVPIRIQNQCMEKKYIIVKPTLNSDGSTTVRVTPEWYLPNKRKLCSGTNTNYDDEQCLCCECIGYDHEWADRIQAESIELIVEKLSIAAELANTEFYEFVLPPGENGHGDFSYLNDEDLSSWDIFEQVEFIPEALYLKLNNSEDSNAVDGAPDVVPGFEVAKTPPSPNLEDSLTQPIVLDDSRPLFEAFTPSSSPPSYEVEMQDSFHDENTS